MAAQEVVQKELKKRLLTSGLRIKWTDSETFHITLLFLGDVAPENINGMFQEVEKTVRKIPKFGTVLNGLGLFRKSGALWVGIDVSPELSGLQKALVIALDMEPGRFYAHFTLGRIKTGRADSGFFQILEKTVIEPVFFEIGALELVKSELLSDGARHTLLGTVSLPES